MAVIGRPAGHAPYDDLALQLEGLFASERDPVANMANFAAAVFFAVPDLNWAGFYLMRDGELVLGPFQGRPACVRIAVGRGVCGTAVARRQTVRVDDVHAFPGHIACDAQSRSELVIPLQSGGQVIGVLDLDSPRPARFTEADQDGFERLAAVLVSASAWAGSPWHARAPALALSGQHATTP